MESRRGKTCGPIFFFLWFRGAEVEKVHRIPLYIHIQSTHLASGYSPLGHDPTILVRWLIIFRLSRISKWNKNPKEGDLFSKFGGYHHVPWYVPIVGLNEVSSMTELLEDNSSWQGSFLTSTFFSSLIFRSPCWCSPSIEFILDLSGFHVPLLWSHHGWPHAQSHSSRSSHQLDLQGRHEAPWVAWTDGCRTEEQRYA